MISVPTLGFIPNHSITIPDFTGSLQLKTDYRSFAFDNILYVDEEIGNPHTIYYKYFFDRHYARLPNNAERRIRIKEPVLYLNYPNQKNYSHFTLQVLSGYLAAESFNCISGDLRIAIDNSLKWQEELIDIYGIDRARIISLDPCTLYEFDKVIYYTSLFYTILDNNSLNLYTDAFQGRDINRESSSSREAFKLYITRREAGRKAKNELDVIEFLKDKGFMISDFADISVQEQIRLINSASVICAPHGASGANLVYKNNQPFKFIELFSNMWESTCHARILQSKNCEYTPVVSPAEGRSSDAQVIVDLGALASALDFTSHKFNESCACRSATNEFVNTAIDAICANRFQTERIKEMFVQGDYEQIYANCRSSMLNNFDSTTLTYIYISTFLCGTRDDFKRLSYLLININPSVFISYVVDLCIKCNDFSLYKYIRELCKDCQIPPYPGFLANMSDNKTSHLKDRSYILTWHNLLLAYDPKFNKLIQSNSLDHSILLISDGTTYSLFIPYIGEYIKCIHADGRIETTLERMPYDIIRFTSNSISIRCNEWFLSSGKRGEIRRSDWSKTWERFFLIDY